MLKKMPEAVSDQFPIIYIKHLIGKDETPDSQTFLEWDTFDYVGYFWEYRFWEPADPQFSAQRAREG